MKVKKAFELVSTDGNIASFKIIESFFESTLIKIAMFAGNLFLYWMMRGFQFDGIFDLIGAVFFSVMMIVSELFLLVIAGVTEISAEIIAGCIAPRPENLTVKPAQQTAAPSVSAPAQAEGKPVTRPIQPAANPSTPPVLRKFRKGSISVLKDDLLIRFFRKNRDKVTPENLLCDIHVHCIRAFEQLQGERGIQVYDIEAFWIWYALTDLLLEAHWTILNPKVFRSNALRAMFVDMPDHTEDFIYKSISDDYDQFVGAVCQLQRDRVANDLPRQSRLECYLDTIGQRFNRRCDAQTQDDLERCIRAALEVADGELKI